MAVDIGERDARWQRQPVDPVQAGTGNLHQPESTCRGAHGGGEYHGNKHLGLRHERRHARLVGNGDIGANAKKCTDAAGEACRQRSYEDDPKHDVPLGVLIGPTHRRDNG